MEEIILNFNYKGQEIKMQCKRNEDMNEIFKRYTNKINEDINNLCFIYNGNKLNNNSKLEEINNKDNEIKILVYDMCNDNNNERIVEKECKDIICPECGENCLIEIKDYKINLNKCDNKHNTDNILLDQYNKTQIIKEIKCNNCNKNKSEIYNNQIYKCCNCNIILCPLCKSNHNKEHKIIDYELINYICKMHGERYTSYCKECEKNICDICEIEHDKNHNLIYHKDIIKNKDNNINELKIKIDNLKKEINDIINKLNKIMNNLEIYYNINNNIINNNNDIRNKNYQILINVNNINTYNDIIINDINNIINENNIINKCKYLYKIYSKMIDNNNNTSKMCKNGKYVGELINDKREGKGIMYYTDGDRYEGEWKNDLFEGKGIYYYKSGSRYEGDFKNGKRKGKGVMYYPDDDRYEGEWKNDLFEGKGIYFYKSGSRYEGDFKNGKREGKGIYYYKNGIREMGDYLNDKQIGKHVALHVNKNITSKDY